MLEQRLIRRMRQAVTPELTNVNGMLAFAEPSTEMTPVASPSTPNVLAVSLCIGSIRFTEQ